MMRKALFPICIFLILAFISCDPCNNLDCLADNYFAQFRIVSKDDQTDLLFGSKQIYEKSKLKFYTISANDTTFFEHNLIKFPGNGYDSILSVKFYPKTLQTVYMKLTDIDTDTLTITYNTINTKCCGLITEITKYRYNNFIDIIGNAGTQEIKK